MPAWMYLVREAREGTRLGPTDVQECYDDAVRIAIRDQIEAGIDVISDGEMRRTMFIRGFYERLTGLKALPVARQLGPPNYDSHCPYEVIGRVEAPAGLGVRRRVSFCARAHRSSVARRHAGAAHVADAAAARGAVHE